MIGIRQSVIQGQLSYRSEKEVGWLPAQDLLQWNVSAAKKDDQDDKMGRGRNVLVNGRVLDSSGKVLRKTEDTIKRARDDKGATGVGPLPRVPLPAESLMIAIEPRDNQAPQAVVHGEISVDEGATEILSPDILTVTDNDTRQENLVVIIDDGPTHGHLEVRDRSGQFRSNFKSNRIRLLFFLLHNIKPTLGLARSIVYQCLKFDDDGL